MQACAAQMFCVRMHSVLRAAHRPDVPPGQWCPHLAEGRAADPSPRGRLDEDGDAPMSLSYTRASRPQLVAASARAGVGQATVSLCLTPSPTR